MSELSHTPAPALIRRAANTPLPRPLGRCHTEPFLPRPPRLLMEEAGEDESPSLPRGVAYQASARGKPLTGLSGVDATRPLPHLEASMHVTRGLLSRFSSPSPTPDWP